MMDSGTGGFCERGLERLELDVHDAGVAGLVLDLGLGALGPGNDGVGAGDNALPAAAAGLAVVVHGGDVEVGDDGVLESTGFGVGQGDDEAHVFVVDGFLARHGEGFALGGGHGFEEVVGDFNVVL